MYYKTVTVYTPDIRNSHALSKKIKKQLEKFNISILFESEFELSDDEMRSFTAWNIKLS